MDNILPIGSVVLIKDGRKPVMIYGYLQQSAFAENELFDYIGVPYPEGNVNAALQFGFQTTDIKEVLFEGYRSEEFGPWEMMIRTAALRHGDEEKQ
jgi:hypothetical protein